MSVDNSAILFLGLPVSRVSLHVVHDPERVARYMQYMKVHFPPESNVGQMRLILENGYLADYLEAGDDDLRLQRRSLDDDDPGLIGFELADSGSYDRKELKIDRLLKDLADRQQQFKAIFGKDARLYIQNYQH